MEDRDMDPKLVYDVGVHNGNDTAYYLHKGFRVVGVEANPVAAEQIRKRFPSEIACGALRLLRHTPPNAARPPSPVT